MACGGAIEPQFGTGKSKTIKRAIHRAFKAAVNAGAVHCFGGSCSDGQMCSYVVINMQAVSVEPITSDPGTSGYEAKVRTGGGCACTNW